METSCSRGDQKCTCWEAEGNTRRENDSLSKSLTDISWEVWWVFFSSGSLQPIEGTVYLDAQIFKNIQLSCAYCSSLSFT